MSLHVPVLRQLSPGRDFPGVCDSAAAATSSYTQQSYSLSNRRTTSLSGNWSVGDKCNSHAPSRALEVAAGREVSRRRRSLSLRMCSTGRNGVQIALRLLAMKRSLEDGKEGVVSIQSEEESDTRSKGLGSCVEEFHKMGLSHRSAPVGRDYVESAMPDEGFAEGFSSDGSISADGDEESTTGGVEEKIVPWKREFCKRCCKAASRCICRLITTQVDNKTGIIILQHPLENNHHLGTARIAVVGLRNVELIFVPEGNEQISCRLRPKVPGSKRQIAGRGGRKAQFLAAQAEDKKKLSKKRSAEPKRQMEATIQIKQETERQCVRASADNQVMKMATLGTKHIEQDVSSVPVPPWINLQPDAGLLFPSEHAVDLLSVGSQLNSEGSGLFKVDKLTGSSARGPPRQLIVLDGTWSKAKRIFYENPWLHSLPHYRLPQNDGASRYGIIRKEPKPGCMSTIESVVLALQTLEPETEGLSSLLDVFDFMIEDQKICMGDKYAQLEEKVRSGLSQKTRPLK